jgi:hypothetical protein
MSTAAALYPLKRFNRSEYGEASENTQIRNLAGGGSEGTKERAEED